MSKVISKHNWNNRTYNDVDVDGNVYRIKNAPDDATAIEQAEAIHKTQLEEPALEKARAISEAVNVLMSAKLDTIDKAKLTELNTKITAAVSAVVKPEEVK